MPAEGQPVLFREALAPEDEEHLHYGELKLDSGRLVTSGPSGYALVVTGRGASPPVAQRAAYALARKIWIPNLRYRIDIADKFISNDGAVLHRLGWL